MKYCITTIAILISVGLKSCTTSVKKNTIENKPYKKSILNKLE